MGLSNFCLSNSLPSNDAQFWAETQTASKQVQLLDQLPLHQHLRRHQVITEVLEILECPHYSFVAGDFDELRILDRKSTRLNSSHSDRSRMPSSA